MHHCMTRPSNSPRSIDSCAAFTRFSGSPVVARSEDRCWRALICPTMCDCSQPRWRSRCSDSRRVPRIPTPLRLQKACSARVRSATCLRHRGTDHRRRRAAVPRRVVVVLRAWCARYGVDVGWNMRRYEDDARARARLFLHRNDGVHSWGDGWPVRRRSDGQTS